MLIEQVRYCDRRTAFGAQAPEADLGHEDAAVLAPLLAEALAPQEAHSYTVIGRRGIPAAGTTMGTGASWWRRRQDFLRQ